MIVSERLQSAMNANRLSQSELARRSGVTQTSIRRLLTGGYGSKFLHRIARELGTTPAFLTGETDDPEGEAPPTPNHNSTVRELIDSIEEMSPADQRALLQIARTMRGSPDAPTVHTPRQEFIGEETR